MNNIITKKQNWRLISGIIAGPFFIFSFLIQGAVRAGYNPLIHPVSALSLGNLGWIQIFTFIITGLLLFNYSLELRNIFSKSDWSLRLGANLVMLLAFGQLAAGIFVVDLGTGYPPGTTALSSPTWHGVIHNLSSLTNFVGLPICFFIFANYFFKNHKANWAIYSVISGIIMIVASILRINVLSYGGLFQRIALVTGLIWLSVFAYSLLKKENKNSLNKH